jgi:hypothetical protein
MTIPNFMLRPAGPAKRRKAGGPRAHGTPLGGGPGARRLANFSIPSQIQNNWCWSAVGAGVAGYYGSKNWTVCELAGTVLNLQCCESPTPGGCDVYGSLDASLKTVGHFRSRSDARETFSVVRAEIDAGRPMAGRIEWARGGAHFVALYGWQIAADGTEMVDVYDSIYSTRNGLPYTKFVSRYRDPGDSWTHSYFTNRSAPALGGGSADPTEPTNG